MSKSTIKIITSSVLIKTKEDCIIKDGMLNNSIIMPIVNRFESYVDI